MVRTLFPLLLLLVLVSCQDLAESPLDGPGSTHESALSLHDARIGGSAGFYFLPPMVSEPSAIGVPDMDRAPRVEICQKDLSNATCSPFATYEGASVSVHGHHYQAQWSGRETGVVLDTPYRVSVHVGAVELGYVDVRFVGNMRAGRGHSELIFVSKNRTIPIRFRIEEGAVVAAVEADECTVDGVAILDCDVQEATPDAETTATVLEPETGDVAGILIIPPGAVPENALVVMKHLGGPIGAASIDPGDQIPFFLKVDVTDLDGNPLTLLQDAELVVCQDPGQHVSTPEMALLKIFKVDSQQQTTILPTNVGDPRCAGYSGNVSADASAQPKSFLARLGGDLARAARSVLRAEPVRALHGGLNTTLGVFSDFGAVVMESTPIGYGSDFQWSSSIGSGVGPGPFSTPWTTGVCPGLDGLVGAGTGDAWPLGSTTQGSILTLTKEFTIPSDAIGVTVWAMIDNDIRVHLNGVDLTPYWQEGQTNNGTIDNGGWLVHENCTTPDAYSFAAAGAAINPGGVNTLVVEARDRGSIGIVDIRLEATF